MGNWIDKYKSLVISSYKQYIIVADQDNLFDYTELKQAFESEGYTILYCNTDLALRLVFELQVRNSNKRYLIVAPATYKPMPDIEMLVHFQPIGLSDLFPNLDSKAIKGLSFNALCLLSNIKPYEDLGHEKTLKFLLENLYNVDFDTLKSYKVKERILNALITVFLEKDGINGPLAEFLSSIAKPHFPTLIQKGLCAANLISFIKDEWRKYVETGAAAFDFNEYLLNKSLGYLFALGYLSPIQVTSKIYDNFPKSLKIGVYVNETNHIDNELEGLIEYLKQQREAIEDIPSQWFKVIQVLSNARLKSFLTGSSKLRAAYGEMESALNLRFQRFIENTYNSLFSLSGVRVPVTVSRVLEHINSKSSVKRALLVIDGMNYWQWLILGNGLTGDGIPYSMNATLAFIPTITAWSRQAIFRGDKPDLSSNNSREGILFKDFWVKHGVQGYQIEYRKFSIDDPLVLEKIPTDTTILGLVCNDLDEIMHGSVMGNDQLKVSTEQWIAKSGIVGVISALRSAGFHIYITADHGNVEARGIKNLTLKDKLGTLSRGKRHLHFSNKILLNSFIEQNPNIEVGRKGFSLYLKKQEAFTNENSRVITHGGSHIWEVIVPFISIDEK